MIQPEDATVFEEGKLEEQILSLEGTIKSYQFGKKIAVFSVKDRPFALLHEGKNPIQLSLKSDPLLAKLLREKYETIMPAAKMDRRFWNTLVLSGQLGQNEVKDLIRHAYELSVNVDNS